MKEILLAERAGRVLSREQLMERPRLVETVRGAGYLLVAEEP
jgi:DNA-binding winged helix-turn-helix (wHTH) protein